MVTDRVPYRSRSSVNPTGRTAYIMASFLRRIRDAGGLRNSLRTLLRVRDVKGGVLVGTDQFGNEYYENQDYIFSRNRWVYLARKDFDASQIPPEWHMWLHHMTEPSPAEQPPLQQKFHQQHEENYSGTRNQYVPYSTTRPKIESWQPPNTAGSQ